MNPFIYLRLGDALLITKQSLLLDGSIERHGLDHLDHLLGIFAAYRNRELNFSATSRLTANFYRVRHRDLVFVLGSTRRWHR